MNRLARAVTCGMAGTLCEVALTRIERRPLGQPPYDTAKMAERLAARIGLQLRGGAARAAGEAMRWSYGPAWGVPLTLLARRLPWPLAGAALGGGLFLFELIALPLTDATPPVARWGARFVAADLLNALTYGEVAAITASFLRQLSAPTPRPAADKEGSHGTDGQ